MVAVALGPWTLHSDEQDEDPFRDDTLFIIIIIIVNCAHTEPHPTAIHATRRAFIGVFT